MTSRWLLTDTALIETRPSGDRIYGRWDRIFGAWRTRTELCLTADEFMLRRQLFDDFGDIHWRIHECDGAADGEDELPIIRYLNLIPTDVRDLVAPYGRYQWQILDAIRQVPGFLDFLKAESRGFGPGYLAACIAFGDLHRLKRDDRTAVYQSMVRKKRLWNLRSLSESLLPGMPFLGTLKSIKAGQFGKKDFERLLILSMEPKRARMVRHQCNLSPEAVRLASMLPTWLLLGNLLPLADALNGHGLTKQFLALAARAEQSGSTHRFSTSIKTVSHWNELQERLEHWALRLGVCTFTEFYGPRELR